MRRKILGVRAAKDRFKQNSILWALLTALTTLPSALSRVLKTIPTSLVVETVAMVWVLGRLCHGRVLVAKWGELPMGRCSLLVWLRFSSQSLDQLALLLKEFWRISWRFRGAMSLTSSV